LRPMWTNDHLSWVELCIIPQGEVSERCLGVDWREWSSTGKFEWIEG
jgi:hypothetical protein